VTEGTDDEEIKWERRGKALGNATIFNITAHGAVGAAARAVNGSVGW
jgi:hypothetical protein